MHSENGDSTTDFPDDWFKDGAMIGVTLSFKDGQYVYAGIQDGSAHFSEVQVDS
jgi:hypothetical protein